jgi:hypothetical protein
LQKQAAEPKKKKAEPEPPEPPKPNGGIQIATAPERAAPSQPELKNKETNPSTGVVARALLRAVSRSSRTKAAEFKDWLVAVAIAVNCAVCFAIRSIEVGLSGIVVASGMYENRPPAN